MVSGAPNTTQHGPGPLVSPKPAAIAKPKRESHTELEKNGGSEVKTFTKPEGVVDVNTNPKGRATYPGRQGD